MSSLDLKEPFVSEAGLIDIVAVDNVVDRLLIMWIKLFNIPFYQVAHQVFDEMSSVVGKRKRFDFFADFIPEKVKVEDA
ncbi:histone-fold protein [Artemisia annua]|uniref:Histone-fold protein n=1 Tax=Artemisia annua TaxID=35608 RepID=A0A2U1NAR7_ARTAN|nr:histone-fold protein [Artemisia annua]